MVLAHLAWLTAIGLLLAYEFWSISPSGKKRGAWPLTWAVWWTFKQWPLLGFLIGFFVGGLAVHFFGGDWSCPHLP